MNPPAQDRNLDHLFQGFRTPFEQWLAAVRAAGYRPMVYETRRTRARQHYLYAQGRTRPGPIITYTLDSAHLYGLAADLYPEVDGQPDWSADAYNRMYRAVPPARYGLELLDFERPHVQLKGGQAAAPRLGLSPESIFASSWPLTQSAKPVQKPAPVIVPAAPKPAHVPLPDQHPVRIFDADTNTQIDKGTLITGTDKVYVRH